VPAIVKRSSGNIQTYQKRKQKQADKNRLTKTAKKQIGTAKNRVMRAKQKLKTAGTKYVGLENKAIELRTELKETSKRPFAQSKIH